MLGDVTDKMRQVRRKTDSKAIDEKLEKNV